MSYVLGVDVWEGNPNLDEATLLAAGVAFMVVRLNDMNGGHHMDQNFAAQWAQAGSFIRWPYFVYNPWVSGNENYIWLAAHMPIDAVAVSVDVEVKKDDYAPADYARQVRAFLDLACLRWNVNLYSGAWFKDCLSYWPSDVPDWWARYPYVVYPANRTNITWDDLKTRVFSLPWSPGSTPGSCMLWQVTADRYILPGCGNTCVDINLWNGTQDELAQWVGQPVSPPENWAHSIDAWARHQPNPYTGPEPE